MTNADFSAFSHSTFTVFPPYTTASTTAGASVTYVFSVTHDRNSFKLYTTTPVVYTMWCASYCLRVVNPSSLCNSSSELRLHESMQLISSRRWKIRRKYSEDGLWRMFVHPTLFGLYFFSQCSFGTWNSRLINFSFKALIFCTPSCLILNSLRSLLTRSTHGLLSLFPSNNFNSLLVKIPGSMITSWP